MNTTPRSPAAMLSVEERRRRVRGMMDEDEDASKNFISTLPNKKRATGDERGRLVTPTKRSKVRATTPPRATQNQNGLSPASNSRLALKFDGRVYRTLDQSQLGLHYSPSGDFFGQPDEEVGEIERQRGDDRRKAVEREILLESGRKSTQGRGEKDDARRTPTKVVLPPNEDVDSAPLLLREERLKLVPLGLPFNTTKRPLASKLPETLDRLLHLHASLESALFAHLAEAGSSLAASTSAPNVHGVSRIRIPRLIDFNKLKRLIESGGRNFAEKDLAELCWVWGGCGLGTGGTEDGLEITGLEGEGLEEEEAGGMGFIISKTRTGSSNKYVATYALGISIFIKSNPQLPPMELLPLSSPGGIPSSPVRSSSRKVSESPGSVRRGREGMSVVALWSQGSEGRRTEFASRLRAWSKQVGQPYPSPPPSKHKSKSKASTTESQPISLQLPPIPRATLPILNPAIVCVPGTSSPSPKKKSNGIYGGEPEGIKVVGQSGQIEALLEGKTGGVIEGKAVDRRKAMEERIRAKALARQPPPSSATFSSLSTGSPEGSPRKSLKPEKNWEKQWHAERMEKYKRNSMLSRMGPVVDGVWMLFSMTPRKRSILVDDAATAIAKSSKIALSLDEAEATLALLCSLCPEFVYVKTIDKQEWLCVKSGGMELQDVKEVFRRELEINAM